MYDYESIKPGYYDLIYKNNSGIQSKWHHMKFNHIYKKIQAGSSVLDIGCGPGTFIGNFESNVFSVGIDISENQIEYAIANYKSDNKQFICADITTLDFNFENKKFDYITCIELIEHLDENMAKVVLKSFRKFLKPHGKIIVTTPNYDSLWPALELLVNFFGGVSYESQHILRLNKERLQLILEQSCLKVHSISNFMGPEVFLSRVRWNLPELVPVKGFFLPGFILCAECTLGDNFDFEK